MMQWVVATMLVGTSLAAQPPSQKSAPSQPDFSGRWVLVRPESAGGDVARTLTVQQPIVRTNVYGAPMRPAFLRITIERQFVASTRTDAYRIGTRGGTVTFGKAGDGGSSTSHFVRWEDNRLVIETGSSSGGGRTEVWQLDSAGMLTVTVTERSSGAESKPTTATYRRN